MARSATMEPILPQPMMPSVFLKISTPMNLFFSHLPARVEVSASGIWRASASISEIACSAVVIELPNGVFITMMPRAVAAGMSTLSTPMPARPITFRFLAFSRILADTLVAERMARPSKPPISSASLSLSLPRLGWKSTSMPRSLKICTAAGESASEMRTLGMAIAAFLNGFAGHHLPPRGGRKIVALRRLRQRGFGLGEGPVEPGRERLHVARFRRRPAPDAQARRRVAVIGDVVGDAFLLEQAGQRLGEGRLIVCRQPRHRRIDHFQADRSVRAFAWLIGEMTDPGRDRQPVGQNLGVGVRARDGSGKPADRFRPLQRVEIILDAQHRRRVDGLAGENALVELAALGEPEDLRQRPSRLMAFEPLN